MMTDGERNINTLFEQMGMDGDDAAIGSIYPKTNYHNQLKSAMPRFGQTTNVSF